MSDVQLSKILGLFSLGLGAFQLIASRRIAAALGVGSPDLVKAVGVREVAAGLMVLNTPDVAMPVWSRVAGDAMDAAVLTTGLGYENRQHGAASAAMIFVLTTMALDVAVAVAASLNRREQTALQTARRTRVHQTAALT